MLTLTAPATIVELVIVIVMPWTLAWVPSSICDSVRFMFLSLVTPPLTIVSVGKGLIVQVLIWQWLFRWSSLRSPIDAESTLTFRSASAPPPKSFSIINLSRSLASHGSRNAYRA